MPRQAVVSFVSAQPNFPTPKTTLTICALKSRRSKLMGKTKKIICLNIPENFRRNSSPSSRKKAMDIEGKEAVETETATALTRIEDKLFAKLKTAIEPAKLRQWLLLLLYLTAPLPNPTTLGP